MKTCKVAEIIAVVTHGTATFSALMENTECKWAYPSDETVEQLLGYHIKGALNYEIRRSVSTSFIVFASGAR